jgi:hypothetical protein
MSLLIDIVKQHKGKSIEKVEKVDSEGRYAVCKTCPFFKSGTKSCGTLLSGELIELGGQQVQLCGCYMPDKVKYKDEHCPIGNW